MKCTFCSQKAVYPNLCKEHFIEYFERKVFDTIERFNLLNKNDKVMVAASGGKDSMTVLYLVKKWMGPNAHVEALVVDEGIAGYRNKTIEDLERFCKEHGVVLNKCSFKEDFGQTLDDAKEKVSVRPCHLCGTFRRALLNKYSQGFDKIATGHNLDDECQAIMMNYLRSTIELSARLGPLSGVGAVKGFTQRVKPLFFCSEKEVLVYTLLKGFSVGYTECPNVTQSYRAQVRDFLNDWEAEEPGVKLRIVEQFLEQLPSLKARFGDAVSLGICSRCSAPSTNKVCNACAFKEVIT
ncbi:TIGR00269 family protein [Candidatus Woesearchaeota archaeon]|nr:MAG: TIGR00269 family protein [Candidatus Woesearchaeota archaeon]